MSRRRRLTEKKGPCWDGYERVPGTKEYEKGSCRKKGSKKNEADEGSDETLEEIRRVVRSILVEKKRKGLWDNIHAKNKRIKAGSGEKKAKPGDDDYPATLDVNETDEMSELAETLKHVLIEEGLWDNIRKKRARGERPARPGEKGYPSEKAWKETTAESDAKGPGSSTTYKMMETDETDENAFVAKAAKAKVDGDDTFELGGKEFDVTIDDETAEEITGEKVEETLRRVIRQALLREFDKDKMKCNSPRYLKKGDTGYGKKQKVVKACHDGN